MPGLPLATTDALGKIVDAPYGRASGPYHHGLISEPNCDECPLKYDITVYPDGPIPARVAFVGEEPGATERVQGRGFVGQSGQLLWAMAEQVGLSRQDVWVSNAALCSARKVKLATGAIIDHKTVKALAARACRSRLLHELIAVDPVVIMPLGNWALWSLTDIPKAKIYGYRGSRLDIDLKLLAELVDRGMAKAPIRQVKNA